MPIGRNVNRELFPATRSSPLNVMAIGPNGLVRLRSRREDIAVHRSSWITPHKRYDSIGSARRMRLG
jgi:hypothetical protein